MKIIAISDLHGQLPEIKESGDVLCICGDIFPLKMQTNVPQCASWLKKTFIPWSDSISCKHVVLIAGNHDFFFTQSNEDIEAIFTNTKIIYLENSGVSIDGKYFHGTPYCHQFGNWAFMLADNILEKMYCNIPENTDVLLTHDAPYGTSDICLQEMPWITGTHIGNIPLRDAILDKKPKLVLHGHLHSTNHNVELMGEYDTEVYNVSLLDENYNLVYNPLILEI